MNSESLFSSPDPPDADGTVRPAGIVHQPSRYPLLIAGCWALILLMVATIAGLVFYSQHFAPKSFEMSAGELIGVNLSTRMMVGLQPPKSEALRNLEQFNTGPLEQRYSHAVMVAEFAGPNEALDQLSKIDQAVENSSADFETSGQPAGFPSETQRELRRVLGELFSQYANGDFDSSKRPERDRQLLVDRLGWVGELALTPANSPNTSGRAALQADGWRVLITMSIAAILAILAILGGVVAIAILASLFLGNFIKTQFQSSNGYGFVYLETFAIWMALFLGLQLVSGVVSGFVANNWILQILIPASFFASLFALAWPLIRGVSWSTMCRDIGWELRNPFVEVLVGGFSYLALILPLLFGIGLTVLLTLGMSAIQPQHEFEAMGPVGHPIAEEIAVGGPAAWIFALIAACIAAPIVEETMFRGVLYRALRESTSRHSKWLSVAMAALLNGLLFALIHPQGLVGIPALATLAIGFSLVREWRNSLIGPMVMHAINNTLLLVFLLLLLS